MIPISRVLSRIDMIIVFAIPNDATRSAMLPSNASAPLTTRKTYDLVDLIGQRKRIETELRDLLLYVPNS